MNTGEFRQSIYIGQGTDGVGFSLQGLHPFDTSRLDFGVGDGGGDGDGRRRSSESSGVYRTETGTGIVDTKVDI